MNKQFNRQHHQGQYNRDAIFNNINGSQKIKDWVTKRIDKEAIAFADGFGRALSKKFSTSQIRNIYGEVKRIQMHGWKGDKTESELLLLKARLAYAAKRSGGLAFKLKDILSAGIDAIHNQQSLENFAGLFEAILAYHKSYGGK